MEGKNEFELNQATMNKAVEYYLNQVIFRESCEVTVEAVTYEKEGYGRTFKVTFIPNPKEQPHAIE